MLLVRSVVGGLLVALLLFVVDSGHCAEGAAMVPLRAVCEAKGGYVFWDGKAVTAVCDGRTITVDPRSSSVLADGIVQDGVKVGSLGGTTFIAQDVFIGLTNPQSPGTEKRLFTTIRAGTQAIAVAHAQTPADYLRPLPGTPAAETWILPEINPAVARDLAGLLQSRLSPDNKVRLDSRGGELILNAVQGRLLETIIPVRRKLSECAINFNPAEAYNNMLNAVTAARYLNGTRVKPGEVFSFNKVLGPRTKEKGYIVGFAFSGKKHVPSLGGGVCRMSTVLYGALLDAGLPIAERHAHSLPVGYATQGRDATVSWGGADLKFRNSTQETLIIESGGTVRRIYAILWSEEEITQPQPKPAPAFPIETLPSS